MASLSAACTEPSSTRCPCPGRSVCLTPEDDVDYVEAANQCFNRECSEGECAVTQCRLSKWVFSYFDWNDGLSRIQGAGSEVGVQWLYDGVPIVAQTVAPLDPGDTNYREV